MIITRFAPSPTGELHLGHVYAAKVAHELAMSQPDGRFLLRFEDIDTSRVKSQYYSQIEADLNWLGFTWDAAPLRQTERLFAYQKALQHLKDLSLVYPCFCTRTEILEEIKRMHGAPHGSEEMIYPGTCRILSKQKANEFMKSGKPHSWRLNSQRAAEVYPNLTFHDERYGQISVDPMLNGDVVLARKDIGIAYHLAVVVDDAYQRITHVTRGEDLLNSTHIHRLVQSALNFPQPHYLHHSLVCDADGTRLAKRNAAKSIQSLKKLGLSAQEILKLSAS